jgi:hypothetical protein
MSLEPDPHPPRVRRPRRGEAKSSPLACSALIASPALLFSVFSELSVVFSCAGFETCHRRQSPAPVGLVPAPPLPGARHLPGALHLPLLPHHTKSPASPQPGFSNCNLSSKISIQIIFPRRWRHRRSRSHLCLVQRLRLLLRPRVLPHHLPEQEARQHPHRADQRYNHQRRHHPRQR